MRDERQYFRRREIDERAAALAARSPEARVIHLELAERYRELAEPPSEALSVEPLQVAACA